MILTISDPEIFADIVSGKKRFEGRRADPKYDCLRPGDYIVFFLEGSLDLAVARVREVRRFPTVREMVRALWKELIPRARSPDEALSVYKRFYSPDDLAVAIGIDVVHAERVRDPRTLRKILGAPVKEELISEPKFLPDAIL